MALKVELKPHERIIIGSCVITNVDQRARLLIEGENTPVLREKDIPAWVDFWGTDVSHDWPWWQRQLQYFVGHWLDDDVRAPRG